MSATEQQPSRTSPSGIPPPTADYSHIDPRLHAIEQQRQAQQRQADQEYSPDVQALLKSMPPNALPPNLAGAARDGGPAGPYIYSDGQTDGEHQHPVDDGADPDGLDNDPNGPYQMADMDGSGRGGRKKRADTTQEDWTRIRKDNHKEVERRRRSNINAGINELSALMPTGGSSDKAKGAILNRAVTYIRQLKENETRNIEKWTLEKLLMDQAMGELQATIDETRRRWDEERAKVGQLEAEVAELRAQLSASGEASASTGSGPNKRPRVE